MPRPKKNSTDFNRVLAHLQDTAQPVPPADLYHLSDLASADLARLTAAWPDLALERRRALLEDLSELNENNYEVSFDDVFRLGMQDEDAIARATAVRALWEAETPDLMAPLLELLLHDPAAEVRAAAASTLGRYVYLGEMEDIPAPQARRIEEALLNVVRSADDLEVRRRALEAVAFSSRAEINDLIAQAYASPELLLRVSAVFAMGRSADARWEPQVQAELDSQNPELRFEAARAAGELEIAAATPQLAELTDDVDPQVRDAAVWSLSQVGGEAAREALMALLETAQNDDDDEQVEFIEDALANLDFTDDLHNFSMFALGEENDALDDLDDLDAPNDLPPPNSRLRRN